MQLNSINVLTLTPDSVSNSRPSLQQKLQGFNSFVGKSAKISRESSKEKFELIFTTKSFSQVLELKSYFQGLKGRFGLIYVPTYHDDFQGFSYDGNGIAFSGQLGDNLLDQITSVAYFDAAGVIQGVASGLCVATATGYRIQGVSIPARTAYISLLRLCYSAVDTFSYIPSKSVQEISLTFEEAF